MIGHRLLKMNTIFRTFPPSSRLPVRCEANRRKFFDKLGQNHYVIQDDWYKGFFSPKNAIMLNLWALHHNEREFPEPDNELHFDVLLTQFIPGRFLDFPLNVAEYAAHPDLFERDHFGFGGGRRICPGLHVAEKSLFINIARSLWGFDIALAKDEDRNFIPVEFTTRGLMPGALSNPKPFKCCSFLSFRSDCSDYRAQSKTRGDFARGVGRSTEGRCRFLHGSV